MCVGGVGVGLVYRLHSRAFDLISTCETDAVVSISLSSSTSLSLPDNALCRFKFISLVDEPAIRACVCVCVLVLVAGCYCTFSVFM